MSDVDERIKLDPVKREWVVVVVDGGFVSFRDHEDFASNLADAKAYLKDVDA